MEWSSAAGAIRPADRAQRRSRDGVPSEQGNSCVAREADAAELPARMRWKEIAVGIAAVTGRRRQRTAAQHILSDHELAIVLDNLAVERAITGIGLVRGARPFPRQ